MISTLLANDNGGGTWWILLVLLGILVVMYIFSYFRRKKYNEQTTNMLDSLKPGDKIKTYSGIYGTIVSIRETTDGKVVTLETGDDKHKSYTSIDSNAIYCIDKKEDIVYDANGNVVEPESENEVSEEVTEQENVADETETAEPLKEEQADVNVVVEEGEEEEKPSKKRSSKK